jgi:hypothetical protein
MARQPTRLAFCVSQSSFAAAYPAAVNPLKVLSPQCTLQYLVGNEPTNAMFVTAGREDQTRSVKRYFHLG